MPLRYTESYRLGPEHRDSITALAFSSEGSYLAVASLDGILSIWSTASGKKHIVVVAGSVPFLSVLWSSPFEDQLLCGLANGIVISVQIDEHEVTVTGFRAHVNVPVECLAISQGVVVTGARSEVFLWDHEGPGCWGQRGQIQPPPSISTNQQAEVIVTSIQWADTRYSQKTLLIAYLHHGILFWDANKFKMVHFFYVKTAVASMSISPDGNVLVVSNLNTGFDIYHLDNSSLDGSAHHQDDGRFFIATGTLVAEDRAPAVRLWSTVAVNDGAEDDISGPAAEERGRRRNFEKSDLLLVLVALVLAYLAGARLGLPTGN
ncbi:WD40-repeat-containing domain protein [Melanogaster broomeanus]|nr:WD40-repeat-containing domain protein [Melanogaster broomeanus]